MKVVVWFWKTVVWGNSRHELLRPSCTVCVTSQKHLFWPLHERGCKVTQTSGCSSRAEQFQLSLEESIVFRCNWQNEKFVSLLLEGNVFVAWIFFSPCREYMNRLKGRGKNKRTKSLENKLTILVFIITFCKSWIHLLVSFNSLKDAYNHVTLLHSSPPPNHRSWWW